MGGVGWAVVASGVDFHTPSSWDDIFRSPKEAVEWMYKSPLGHNPDFRGTETSNITHISYSPPLSCLLIN